MAARHLRENTSTVSALYLNPETGTADGQQDQTLILLGAMAFLKKTFWFSATSS
jgi:hypothetical protein